jgi:hypothetical protein
MNSHFKRIQNLSLYLALSMEQVCSKYIPEVSLVLISPQHNVFSGVL